MLIAHTAIIGRPYFLVMTSFLKSIRRPRSVVGYRSLLSLLTLLLLSHPHAGSLLAAYYLLPVCGRTAHRSILGRKGALLHAHYRQTMRTLSIPIWVGPQPPRGGTVDRQRYNILTTRSPPATSISSVGQHPARASAAHWSQTHSGPFQRLGGVVASRQSRAGQLTQPADPWICTQNSKSQSSCQLF